MDMQHLIKDPVLAILLLASLVSWAIIIDRLLALLRVTLADRAFRDGKAEVDAPLARFTAEINRHRATEHEQLLVLMDTSITLQRQRLERALPLLGVIGSTAPYAGLLGTVIGIIQAFQAIQAHNNMSPSVVSGGIATALIATAIGLAVAIPAVAAHHLFVSAINRRVALWEAAVAVLLSEEQEEAGHGALPVG